MSKSSVCDTVYSKWPTDLSLLSVEMLPCLISRARLITCIISVNYSRPLFVLLSELNNMELTTIVTEAFRSVTVRRYL